MSPLIKPFSAIGLADRPLVGGKGASLGALQAAGLPVPEGVVLTTEAFAAFCASLPPAHAPARLAASLDPSELDRARRIAEEVAALFAAAPLPAAVDEALSFALSSLDPAGVGEPLAVRSSATSEDGAATSFAGLQETELWVRGREAVERAVRTAWASLYSAQSMLYRRHHRLEESDQSLAVVLQRMVAAEVAGVMFTVSPSTGDPSVVVIEACFGLGSALVGGEVTPDRFVVSKITGEVISRQISPKTHRHRPAAEGGVVLEAIPPPQCDQPTLDEARLGELLALARKIEALYGGPQDVEWAIGPTLGEGASRLYLLQSRPETVHTQRPRGEPLARPQARPFDHVFAVLGRREGRA